jgi:pyruvate/2-oxoglutarate dehydrogenase complex dihydrolipoamide dehydrogenase (E3) component
VLCGCVPKKILVGAAEAVQTARDLTGHGVLARGILSDPFRDPGEVPRPHSL